MLGDIDFADRFRTKLEARRHGTTEQFERTVPSQQSLTRLVDALVRSLSGVRARDFTGQSSKPES
jgi:hypothetical protein